MNTGTLMNHRKLVQKNKSIIFLLKKSTIQMEYIIRKEQIGEINYDVVSRFILQLHISKGRKNLVPHCHEEQFHLMHDNAREPNVL